MRMKDEYRRKYRKLREQLSDEKTKTFSDKICSRIHDLPEYMESDGILAYMAFRKEVDLKNIMLTTWEKGKKLFLPRMEGEQMEFHLVNPGDTLVKNSLGIEEPDFSAPILQEIMPAGSRLLMIMPGLAFDRRHCRLGYGGGYYDRYIPEIREWYILTTAAAAYSIQIDEEGIPLEETDIQPQMIITESQII